MYDSPLHTALRDSAERQYLAALIRYGANFDRNSGFGTPLYQARMRKNEDAIQILIENNREDKPGNYKLAELSLLSWLTS